MRLLVPFLLAAALAACSSTRQTAATTPPPAEATAPAKTFVDAWDVTIAETPMGTVEGVLTLTEGDDGTLGGTLVSQGATIDLKTAERTDDGVLVTFYYPEAGGDVPIRLTGDADADALTGVTMGQFMTTARRQ